MTRKSESIIHPFVKGPIEPGLPYPYSPELIKAFLPKRRSFLKHANNYAEAIFLLREYLGYSIPKLAARIGVNGSVLDRAEANKSVPRPQVLRDLAKLAADWGLEQYEMKLNVEARNEEDRIMARSRHASPRES